MGKGSRFTIKIPISKNQISPGLVEAEEEYPVMIPQNLNILIIDDEKCICDVVKKVLEEDGHSVATTLSGRKGLRLFKGETFDLVLSDITMPDIDGAKLISKLKNMNPQVKLITLTGHVEEEKLNKVKKAGADQILLKPFKKEDLYKAIGKTLSI
jgi:CheY-like chemotaxis protein